MHQLPLMNTVEHLRNMETMSYRGGGKGTGVEGNECGLCYQNFEPTDDVVYCTNHHLFHVRCFDEAFEDISSRASSIETMLVKCPTCKGKMFGLNETSSQFT